MGGYILDKSILNVTINITMVEDDWGFHIKRLRKERGLTQEELANKSGLNRGYLSRIESGYIKKSSRDTFQRLASGLGMSMDELDEYITGKSAKITETPEQILERLRLAQPMSVPVYTEFPFHAGDPVEPVEYIYRTRARGAKKGIEGYMVHGECLQPQINDGDIIIVDREASIDSGDIVACLIKDELHIGKLRKVADDLYLENNHGRYKFEECQVAAPVIECIRRLK